MKNSPLVRKIAAAVAATALMVVGATATTAQDAGTARTVESSRGTTVYEIPPAGRGYCFNAAPDLPADLPVCPHVALNGTVAPDPNVGPVAVPAH